jgi:hypothetical protein
MERIFDGNRLRELADIPAALDGEQVRLKRQHLWLSASVAKDTFGGERQVYTVFYPQRGMLLLAPMSDTSFKSLHECSLIMLKDRNLAGDKSLNLQEVIIDNNLDDSDRPLEFTTRPGLQLLQVKLADPQQP